MKKFFAVALALVMMLCCACALAEAAYSYSEYSYDESLFTEIGGEWIAMEGLGLMFYQPDIYLPAEVPQEAADQGIVALFMSEGGTSEFSISYGPAIDVEGNPAASIEDLAAYYTALGATNVDVIIVNGIPVVTSLFEESNILNYSVFFADSTQCIVTFAPASDANTAVMGGLVITTLMVME